MKKLLNMIVAIIIMATNSNVFAQKIDENTLAANGSYDAKKKMSKNTFNAMTYFERIMVVQTLREYQKQLDLKLDTITMENLEDIMLNHSTVVTGDQVPGPVRAYEFSKDGYGEARYYWLTYGSNDKFIVLLESGLPYVQVKGARPYSEPQPVIVRRTSGIENTTPIAPLIAEAPKPKPMPTQTVALQQPVQATGCTTIVNNYVSSGGDNHSCSNGGCANYGCVELAARVYPINYFEAPVAPRPPYGSRNRNCNNGSNYYGGNNCNNSYGYSGGVSVWWNGGYYYPYNNYWYCRNTGKQVCAEDYSYICKKYGNPGQHQNSNTYNGPHKSITTSSGNNMIFKPR